LLGQPAYSASPLKIRSQTVALGSLDIVKENEDDPSRTQTDPNAPKESGLSLLLKANTPPETNGKGDEGDGPKDDQSIIITTDENDNDNRRGDQQDEPQHSDQITHPYPSSHPVPSANSTDQPLYLQKPSENLPLLSQPYPTYGNNNFDDDDSVIDEYYEPSWTARWFCCGDSYLPHYDDDEFEYGRDVKITPELILKEAIIKPIGYIPAVILGLLLNLLDAISYGMIRRGNEEV
jgi:hypothetical protein